MRHYLALLGVFLIYFSTLSSSVGVSGEERPDLKRQVEAMGQRLEDHMEQSNRFLQQGDYYQAERFSEEVIQDLDRLIEATMPLDERIKSLLAKEEAILDQTRQLEGNIKAESTGAESKGELNDLIEHQTVNREKTEDVVELVKRQLTPMRHSPGKQAKEQEEESRQADQELTAVKGLLHESASYQSAAIADLKDQSLAAATVKEKKAIEALEKALEALQKASQSKSDPQKDSGQGQQNQDRNQDSSGSPSPQTDPKQAGAASNPESGSLEESEDQKMSAKEALKELLRLRKEAKEEKERRMQRYGVPADGEKAPVEKDW